MPKKISNLPNQFYDINKFPSEEGMLVFPISMSRIGNDSQSAKKYWEYIGHINPSKINKNSSSSKVGALFVYGDFLYLYSEEPAFVLKKRFMNLVVAHKNAFQRLLKGHPHLIHDAFSFKVWNQFYIENDKFLHYFESLKKIYKTDKKFQRYLISKNPEYYANDR